MSECGHPPPPGDWGGHEAEWVRSGSPAAPLPRSTWDRIFARATRLLVLDFDAALARFLTTRREPRLAPSLIQVLKAVAAMPGNGLVVHSGRGIDEFRGLLRELRAHLIGEQGWEERGVDGRRIVHQLPGRARRRLEDAARAAEAMGWKTHLVSRRCSLTLRTSGLPTDCAGLLRTLGERLWSPAFETDGLRLHPTSEGLELRAVERSTDAAVEEAVRRLWPAAIVIRPALAGEVPNDPGRLAAADRALAVFGTRRSADVWIRLSAPSDLIRFLRTWQRHEVSAGSTIREPHDG